MTKSLKNKLISSLFVASLQLIGGSAYGLITIAEDPTEFSTAVSKELNKMRSGDRGWIIQDMVERMDQSPKTVAILPLTRDPSTWHPNDRRGTRSHVVPQDILVRGAARPEPTNANLYLHPNRIQPNLSVFKLGTFARELAEAHDVALGKFSGDYRLREKRGSFFQNAWRDSLGLSALSQAGRVDTSEFERMKRLGFIKEEYADQMPLLDLASLSPQFQVNEMNISDLERLTLSRFDVLAGQFFKGEFSKGAFFLKVLYENNGEMVLRYGKLSDGQFEIYEGRYSIEEEPLLIDLSAKGPNFSSLRPKATQLYEGEIDRKSEKFSKKWFQETSEF